MLVCVDLVRPKIFDVLMDLGLISLGQQQTRILGLRYSDRKSIFCASKPRSYYIDWDSAIEMRDREPLSICSVVTFPSASVFRSTFDLVDGLFC